MNHPSLPTGFIFSQASLQDYADCPRRFQLRYIEQLQWPAVESEPALENERRQMEGQLFHRMVQQYSLGIPPEKILSQVSSPDLQRWWGNFIQHPIGLPAHSQHTELSLSTPLAGKYRLTAKFDLVAIQPGNDIQIFDWKTYSKRPRDEFLVNRWQTRVYRLLMVEAGRLLFGGSPIKPEVVSMTYWFTEYPTQPARFVYTTAQYSRDKSTLEKMVEVISSISEFPKTDEERKCSFCIYRSLCDRKVAIAEDLFLEDEPAEPEINFEQIQEIAF